MKLLDSHIVLQNLKFHARHGVLPQEQLTGNGYRVDLRIGYDISKAMVSDDVCDTLNYAEVYQAVAEEMQTPSALIERVAGRIGERLMRQFPKVQEVELKIVKQNPPMGADCDGAGIEAHFARS